MGRGDALADLVEDGEVGLAREGAVVVALVREGLRGGEVGRGEER